MSVTITPPQLKYYKEINNDVVITAPGDATINASTIYLNGTSKIIIPSTSGAFYIAASEVGFFSETSGAAQQNTPVTQGDIIALLQIFGLSN